MLLPFRHHSDERTANLYCSIAWRSDHVDVIAS